jgi:hypothetical protein
MDTLQMRTILTGDGWQYTKNRPKAIYPAIEIENALPGTLQPADASEETATATQPTTGRKITVDQLFGWRQE